MIYAAPVVGGPLDGQKLARNEQYHDGYEFVPIYMDSNNEINVWKPVGQTRLVTLKKLLQGYKP